MRDSGEEVDVREDRWSRREEVMENGRQWSVNFWASELKSENVCLFLRYVSGKEKYIKWFRRICQAEGK